MLEIFWKTKNPKMEFQDALEGMTRILIHQIRVKDKSATRNLESLKELVESYLELLEMNPTWFRKLSVNEDFAHRIKDDFSSSFFYDDYAETVTKVIRNISQIFDAAYEVKEDDISHAAVHIAISALKKLSSTEGNSIFINVILDTLSKLHYEMVNETRPVIHTLSVQWYIIPVFNLHGNFRLEYLERFNKNLFVFLKRFPKANNDTIFQTTISSLVDGIMTPVGYGEEIYNFYFSVRRAEEKLPYSFHDLENVLNKNTLGNSINDIQEKCQKIDIIVEALLPYAPDRANELLKAKEKTKQAIQARYAYWSLLETLFITASYFLFKRRYDYIFYMWNYHQPSDADATWCGEDIIPETLDVLFSLYFKNIYFQRKHLYFEDHHGTSGYFFRYFVLLAMRLISNSNQTSLDLKQFSINQKSSIKEKLESVNQAADKLSKDTELMNNLGFKLENLSQITSNLEAYVSTIKSNIDSERDSILLKDSPSQLKINEFKIDFIAGFNGSASAREWFVHSGLFENKISQELPSAGSRYGIYILLDKEIFFEEWDVSYLDFGRSMGTDMATDESKKIFEKISTHCMPLPLINLRDAIISTDIELKNILIFASYQFFHYVLDEDINYLPDWQIQGETNEPQIFKGYYQIDGHSIPIYLMPLNKPNCLLLDKNRLGSLIQHNPFSPNDRKGADLLDEKFYFYLSAFSENTELLQQYLEDSTEIIKKEEYLKKKMLFEVLERIEFHPSLDFKGYSITTERKKRRNAK